MEFPGCFFESMNLSRDTLSREIGRVLTASARPRRGPGRRAQASRNAQHGPAGGLCYSISTVQSSLV